MWTQLALLIGLFAVLGFAARRVIRALVILGTRLRVSSFVLGFVILGLFTSAPEMLVALDSSIAGTPTLSVGNLIGASFVLLSLITGLSVIWNKKTCVLCLVRARELLWFSLIVFLPVILAADGVITPLDGFILIGLFLVYMLFMLFGGPSYHVQDGVTRHNVRMALGMFLIGVVLLLVAARYIVQIGSELAGNLGVSPLFIGLVVFSVGTNLPELALAFTSRKQPRKRFIFGDILGSAAANSLIFGVLGIFGPVVIRDRVSFFIAGGFLLAALMMFTAFSISKRSIGTREGFALVSLHLIFLAVLAFSGLSLQ